MDNNPNPAPRPAPTVDLGVRDYEVRMPVTTGDSTTGYLTARVPAPTPGAAVTIGAAIAVSIESAHDRQDTRRAFTMDLGSISALDVDGTPSAAELTAEVDHFRRVLTALTGKYPLLLTSAEYEAADPARLVAVRVEDNMLFTTTPATPEVPEVGEPLLLPVGRYGRNIPADPGGPDPDMRCIRARNLGRFASDGEEILVHHDEPRGEFPEWHHLRTVLSDEDFTEVTTADGDRLVTYDNDALVVIRPATVESRGADLPADVDPWTQVLHDGVWRDMTNPPTGNLVSVGEVDHDDTTMISFEPATPVLLRETRNPAWVRAVHHG